MKQTEIGVIPENWEVINLNKNFTLKARIGWQGLTVSEYLDSGDYILVTGTDFKKGYIDWDNVVFVEKERYVQDPNIQLKTGDILVTKDGTIGKVAFISNLPNPATLNSGVFVIRPMKTGIISQYIYYVLMSFYFNEFLSKITAGSTITHLYQKDFIHFNLPLPPLSEQQTIAESLSDTDSWIESLEALIEKKRHIKQGAMQELLRSKAGWISTSIEALVVKDGGIKIGPFGSALKKELLVNKGYKVYGQENVFENCMELGNRYIDNEHFVRLKSCELRAGDLILSMMGTIGKCMIVPPTFEPGIMDSHLIRLRLNKELILSDYLLHYFKAEIFQMQIKKLSVGGIMDGLSSKIIKQVLVDIPPTRCEQLEIALKLSDMDKDIEGLEEKLSKARQIKQGMMQQLLTGKIRLVRPANAKVAKTLKRVTA